MIQFDSVSKRYPGGHEALKNVSFQLPQGEMCFLTGHSGAGKSTLLKLIMLMERATQGQVICQGVNLARISKRHIPLSPSPDWRGIPESLAIVGSDGF